MSDQTRGITRRGLLAGLGVFGAAVLANPVRALGETSAEKQAQADAERANLVNLQAELETASANYYAALDELAEANDAIDACNADIESASARIAVLQDHLGTRVKSMYMSGSMGIIDFLLGAVSFEDFANKWSLLERVNESDSKAVQETSQLKAQLQESKVALEEAKETAVAKEAECASIKADTEAKVAEAAALVESLDAEAAALLEEEQAEAARQAAAAAAAQTEYDEPDEDTGEYREVGGPYTNVVDAAMSRIGCPYEWGGSGPDSFDCSGLVYWSYAQCGMSVPHYSESLYACAVNRVPVSEARPGDVLYRPGHVGIAVGYGGVPYVHAPTFGAYVRDTDPLSWSGFTHALQMF